MAMEITNTRKSRRKIEPDENGNNCTYGLHSGKITNYTHINEEDFKSKDELRFILNTIQYQ